MKFKFMGFAALAACAATVQGLPTHVGSNSTTTSVNTASVTTDAEAMKFTVHRGDVMRSDQVQEHHTQSRDDASIVHAGSLYTEAIYRPSTSESIASVATSVANSVIANVTTSVKPSNVTHHGDKAVKFGEFRLSEADFAKMRAVLAQDKHDQNELVKRNKTDAAELTMVAEIAKAVELTMAMEQAMAAELAKHNLNQTMSAGLISAIEQTMASEQTMAVATELSVSAELISAVEQAMAAEVAKHHLNQTTSASKDPVNNLTARDTIDAVSSNHVPFDFEDLARFRDEQAKHKHQNASKPLFTNPTTEHKSNNPPTRRGDEWVADQAKEVHEHHPFDDEDLANFRAQQAKHDHGHVKPWMEAGHGPVARPHHDADDFVETAPGVFTLKVKAKTDAIPAPTAAIDERSVPLVTRASGDVNLLDPEVEAIRNPSATVSERAGPLVTRASGDINLLDPENGAIKTAPVGSGGYALAPAPASDVTEDIDVSPVSTRNDRPLVLKAAFGVFDAGLDVMHAVEDEILGVPILPRDNDHRIDPIADGGIANLDYVSPRHVDSDSEGYISVDSKDDEALPRIIYERDSSDSDMPIETDQSLKEAEAMVKTGLAGAMMVADVEKATAMIQTGLTLAEMIKYEALATEVAAKALVAGELVLKCFDASNDVSFQPINFDKEPQWGNGPGQCSMAVYDDSEHQKTAMPKKLVTEIEKLAAEAIQKEHAKATAAQMIKQHLPSFNGTHKNITYSGPQPVKRHGPFTWIGPALHEGKNELDEEKDHFKDHLGLDSSPADDDDDKATRPTKRTPNYVHEKWKEFTRIYKQNWVDNNVILHTIFHHHKPNPKKEPWLHFNPWSDKRSLPTENQEEDVLAITSPAQTSDAGLATQGLAKRQIYTGVNDGAIDERHNTRVFKQGTYRACDHFCKANKWHWRCHVPWPAQCVCYNKQCGRWRTGHGPDDVGNTFVD